MRSQSQKGFTLIEMMIVVVIIAIVASIALPAYQNYVRKAKIQGGQSDLVGLALSAESRYQRQLSYPNSSVAGTTNLKTTFTTWNPTSQDFTYAYNTSDSGVSYTLSAVAGTTTSINGCTLTLSNTGVKSATNCTPITQWTN